VTCPPPPNPPVCPARSRSSWISPRFCSAAAIRRTVVFFLYAIIFFQIFFCFLSFFRQIDPLSALISLPSSSTARSLSRDFSSQTRASLFLPQSRFQTHLDSFPIETRSPVCDSPGQIKHLPTLPTNLAFEFEFLFFRGTRRFSPLPSFCLELQ